MARRETPGLTGAETIVARGTELYDASVLNFWQWAYSDLRDNVNRGVFAEWLVAKLLGLSTPSGHVTDAPRPTWSGWDLETPEGVRIEVKCSGYLQSSSDTCSKVVSFGRLCGRLWDPQTGEAERQTYNADVYVFCVLSERDPARVNSLDLDQWVFYILGRDALASRGWKSITLNTLDRLTPKLAAAELQEQVRQAIKSIVEQREAARTDLEPKFDRRDGEES